MVVKYYEAGQEVSVPQFRLIDKVLLSPGDKIQLYGSTEDLIGMINLNEYGWKYYPERPEYEGYPLDLLSDETKLELAEARDFHKVFCATVGDGEQGESEISYFGTFTSKQQRLMMIKVAPEFTTADLYDGQDRKISLDFTQEGDCWKVVWFVFTFGGSDYVSDINLTLATWKSLEDPNRNVDEYLAKLPLNFDQVKDINGYLTDVASGTILGHSGSKIENTPILDSLMEEEYNEWDKKVIYPQGARVIRGTENWLVLGDNESYKIPFNLKLWTGTKTYKRGDIVVYRKRKYYAKDIISNPTEDPENNSYLWGLVNEKTLSLPCYYLSLVNGNRGNDPKFSPMWARDTFLNSIMLERGIIKFSEGIDHSRVSIGTYSYPTSSVKFDVTFDPGYILYDGDGFSKANYDAYESGTYTRTITKNNPGKEIELSVIPGKGVVNGVEYDLFSDYTQNLTIPERHRLTQVTLEKKTREGVISEEIITDYERVDNILTFNGKIDYPCEYTYSLKSEPRYSSIIITDYLGFYVDKTIDYDYSGEDITKLAKFRFAPVDGIEHRIKLTFNRGNDSYEYILNRRDNQNPNSGWVYHRQFTPSPGVLEFGLQGERDWDEVKYYTLLAYGFAGQDVSIKVEIIE